MRASAAALRVWTRCPRSLARPVRNVYRHAVRCMASLAEPPTIFALSTGAGRSAVAVVRLTGSKSGEALTAMAPALVRLPAPRLLHLVEVVDPASGQLLDKALVTRFSGPRSYTGEDCVEFHLHGGPSVVRSVLAALGSLPGLRPAEPGEFTRRAFEAGKLDLTEVEGLADLLAAGTQAQHRQALLHATGAVRRRYEGWRARLLTALAAVEAVIDFGEDEGIADEVAAGVLPDMRALRAELAGFLGGGQRGQLVRDGVRVALVGPPNAGKSSLLNALAGRDAAIVSPFPGTTRDVMELELELGGQRVILADCAGIRETEDPVEAEGVRRARATLATAHIVVQLRDAQAVWAGDDAAATQAGDWGGDSTLGELSEAQLTLSVWNKADLLAEGQGPRGQGFGMPADLAPRDRGPPSTAPLLISCETGEGLDDLTQLLGRAVEDILAQGGDPEAAALVTRARHAAALSRCVAALERYEGVWAALELAAEELRGATRGLGAISGVVDTEEVLDSVFSEFCIGK
uniref:TrmE-type G domain-containing protein n=2 Tax=Auxenochlorella protothecoides TaxID=3075 RepID=A0A1D1ZN39_AUXPR